MQGGIDKNAYMPIIKLYKTLASKKYHSLSRQISVFFVMFILDMSVQICRATQFIHSLKRRAPSPLRSAASNSALVGASMPTCKRGNDCETVHKCNAMQCPALIGILAPTSVRRSRYFSCKRKTYRGADCKYFTAKLMLRKNKTCHLST